MVADGGRIVVDTRPLLHRPLEHVGGVDVFHVEGRVLAHDHGIDRRQGCREGLGGPVPGLVLARGHQRGHARHDLALVQADVALQAAHHTVARRLGRPHHGNAGFLLRLEGIEGIEDEKNVHAPPAEKG